MKKTNPATILTLLLLCLASASTAAAQSTNGLFQFTLEGTYTKYLEFDAAKRADGGVAGRMYFSDEAPLSYQDVDGDRSPVGTVKGFFIAAALDELVVTKNQAVMGGVIRDSSVAELVGLRVLLTVEDNGDNTREPDRVTWGAYKFEPRTWTPSDAELKEDPGVGLRWQATDAERKDDLGILMPRKEEPVGAQTFPTQAYSFADAIRPTGDIVVIP